MVDLFTIQTFILNVLIISALSGVFYIKNKQLETIKTNFIYSISIYFLNIYHQSTNLLILGILIGIYLLKYDSNKAYPYLIASTAITLINSTYTNFWYILVANLIISFTFFLLFSKIIFKNSTKQQTITLDQIEWSNLNKNNQLQDKLQALTPGVIKNIHLQKIDTIREEVTLNIRYEQ